MPLATSPVVKVLVAALLIPLTGCGSFYNLATGPQVYGGVQQDTRWVRAQCSGNAWFFDFPGSFAVDTGLLPLTALFELVRWMTGWPPPGVR